MSHESNLGLPFSILNDGSAQAASGMALGSIDLPGAPVLDDLGLIRATPDVTADDAVDLAREPVAAANATGLIARSSILASHAAHGNIDGLTNAHGSYYAPASAANALSFADQAAPGAIGNHGIIPDVVAPTITTGGTVTYLGEYHQIALDPGATLQAGSTITSATVTIASGYTAGDWLNFGPLPGGMTFSYSGGVLTLTGAEGFGEYQTVLDSVTYFFNGGADPTSGGSDASRTIDWQVTASYGGKSNVGTSTLDIHAPPVVTASGSVNYVSGGPAVVLDAALTVSDPGGNGNLTGAVINLGEGSADGDVLNFTSQHGITGYMNYGALILTGTATVADYQAALESVTYTFTPASGDPTQGGTNDTRSVEWTVSDGVSISSDLVSSTINVDVAPAVSSLSGSAVSGADFTNGYTATFTLDVSKDVTVGAGTTLALSDGGTATYVSGSGTTDLTFSYSATDAPQALTVTGIGAGSIQDSDGVALPISNLTVAGYSDAVTDTAANVSANFDSLDAAVASISSITLTDGGTPNLDLTAAQILNDQTLIGEIAPGSYALVLVDSAANIAANFDALESTAGSISSVQFTDGGTPSLDLTAAQVIDDQTLIQKITGPHDLVLDDRHLAIQADFDALAADAGSISSVHFDDGAFLSLTASQIINDQALIGEIGPGSTITLSDTAANISANFNALTAVASTIAGVVVGPGPRGIDLTASELLANGPLIAKIGSNEIIVNDSVAAIQANIDALNDIYFTISSVQFTDGGTPSLDVTAVQLLNDLPLLFKITGPHDIVLDDSAANIQADFGRLDPDFITSIQFTDSGTPNLDLSASLILYAQATVGKITPGSCNLVLNDSAATIAANFDALATHASEISSVQFTDSGTPGLDLNVAQVLGDQALIGKLTPGSCNLVLNDSAVNIAANFDSLASDAAEFSSVVFTDSGTPNLNLTAYSILNDQALIAELTPGSCNLVLSDTAANIAANFDSLESYVSGIASVRFSDGGTPTLDLTPTQVTNDAALFAKIQGAFDLLVTGASIQTSYENDYDASGKLVAAVGFSASGLETITGLARGLTLTGTANNDTFHLQSAPAVTAFGGAGNDLFFFGSGFSSSDAINGGAGNNTIELDGTYTALTISTSMMTNIQTLELVKGHSFNMTLDAGVVTTGETLTISAATLGAGDALTVNGSALTAGTLVVDAGAGADDLTGGAGTNIFNMAGFLTASDEINGGTGTTKVDLSGDYSAGLTFNSTTMINVGTLDLTAGHSYDLTLNAATVASGQTMTIQGGTLGASDNMTIDGAAAAGTLAIYGGAGTNDLIGGTGNDTIRAGSGSDTIAGGAGADKLFAGSGADTFAYYAASDSTSTTRDIIDGFNTGLDKIELLSGLSGVTVINTAVTTGNLSSANFDRALAHDIGAAQLSAHGAVLFTPSTGGYAHDIFLIIDENGVAGYQAGQDLVIELTHGVNLASLSLSNFETAA
jgi:Ca2+-binding RTX toxin-like protein